MKAINEMKLTLESHSVNESFSRVAVSAFVAGLDPTIEEISDIKTAVSEAVTNCIVHAYKNTVGRIYIWVGIFADQTVKIRIRDRGCGIADIHKAMTPLFSSEPEERAGLGFAVMQSFCDKITVRSTLGKGTTVTLIKKIESKERC
ncbi:MAG: anti-sigma F factor [Clostridia bacterium]|nr:anti-sigma F factor [Clostridia bacterium]